MEKQPYWGGLVKGYWAEMKGQPELSASWSPPFKALAVLQGGGGRFWVMDSPKGGHVGCAG